MEIDHLGIPSAADPVTSSQPHLISSSVTDHDKETPVIRLDTFGDERRYARVELLSHLAKSAACTGLLSGGLICEGV